MEYLLKANAIIVLFYVTYKLFLERNTFFNQNRYFLLAGLLTSFLLPLFVIPNYIEYTNPKISDFATENFVEIQSNTITEPIEVYEKPFDILVYVPLIYGLGILFFAIKFILQIISLSLVILKNKSRKENGFTFIETSGNQSPFSFFNFIIFNPNAFSKNELHQIITHEKVHSKQKYSMDVLLAQISCIVFWFNPFIWLYSKAMKQNLEFIADQKTQTELGCKITYQKTLLNASISRNKLSVINTFYNSLIKKRIVMLNKSKSKKVHLLKYVVIIPLLSIFLMNFNTKDVYVEKVAKTSTKNNFEEFIIYNHFSEVKMQEFISELKEKGFNFDLKEIERNTENQITSLGFEIEKNGIKGEYGIRRPTPLKTTVIRYLKKANKFDIKTLAFFNSEELNAKSKNVVEIVFDKNTKVAKLKKQQKELKEKYDVDFTFRVIENKGEFDGYSYRFKNNFREAPYLTTTSDTKVILKYNLDNKMFSSYIESNDSKNHYGMVAVLDKTFITTIKSSHTNNYLEQLKNWMKERGVTTEFSNIKRNVNNEIIAISLNAKKNDGKVVKFIVDGKKPIVKIDITFYKNSNFIMID